MFKMLFSGRGLSIIGGAFIGNMVAERFLLKADESDATGFFLVADGFGVDDVVRGAAIAVAAFTIDRFI